MVGIQHASDSVESEAIELVLIHPEAKIAQQEAQYFMVAVVEETAVPELMTTLCTFMEVEVIAAIKHVQSVQHILGSVTVHDIEQDCDSHAVGSIDQLFEVVWGPVSATGGKKAINLVAKACVVCVLHDCH